MKNKSGFGLRMWLSVILVGLAGQFAWSLENMYLNTYITYLNFTDPSGQGFPYSSYIAITTASSAAVATLTTIFMGALTDKVGKRKLFISVGYVLWGVCTMAFGLCAVNESSPIIKIGLASAQAAILVIVLDCVMTFFGSTSNDAAFSAYVTANTDESNRGKVEGVLQILSLISMLVIFVGFNPLTTEDANGEYHWDLFFYLLGGIVLLTGIVSFFLIPKEKENSSKGRTYLSVLSSGFRPSTVKAHPTLYFLFLIYLVFASANQIFFPYLLVYIERTCEISNVSSSFLTPFALVMAIALLGGSVLSVLLGNLGDRFGKDKLILPSLGIMFAGTFLLFFVPRIGNETVRTVYAAISGLIMITGFVGVPTIVNALIREQIPKGEEGTFMGVRMLFVVALPMLIGPFIGDALNSTTGRMYKSSFGVESALPSPYAYLVSAFALLLALIPCFCYFRSRKETLRGTEK